MNLSVTFLGLLHVHSMIGVTSFPSPARRLFSSSARQRQPISTHQIQRLIVNGFTHHKYVLVGAQTHSALGHRDGLGGAHQHRDDVAVRVDRLL